MKRKILIATAAILVGALYPVSASADFQPRFFEIDSDAPQDLENRNESDGFLSPKQAVYHYVQGFKKGTVD